MSSSTHVTVVVMRCFRSFTHTGREGPKALSLIYPHKKKSQGIRSGQLCDNVSVTCSGMLNGQSDVEADFDSRNFEPPYASETDENEVYPEILFLHFL
jgi:hypothetical protein